MSVSITALMEDSGNIVTVVITGSTWKF